jgi:glycerol-3-phosphate dehydrogenase (NAD(P)+)
MTREIFENDYLKIELTDSPASILFCGAIKNVYAIGAGLLGLEPTSSIFANYIEKSLSEIRMALTLLRLNPDATNFSCGVADLIMTCASAESRNYAYGQACATDSSYQPDYTIEGLTTIRHLPDAIKHLPIISAIRGIIDQRQTIQHLTAVITSHDF